MAFVASCSKDLEIVITYLRKGQKWLARWNESLSLGNHRPNIWPAGAPNKHSMSDDLAEWTPSNSKTYRPDLKRWTPLYILYWLNFVHLFTAVSRCTSDDHPHQTKRPQGSGHRVIKRGQRNRQYIRISDVAEETIHESHGRSDCDHPAQQRV